MGTTKGTEKSGSRQRRLKLTAYYDPTSTGAGTRHRIKQRKSRTTRIGRLRYNDGIEVTEDTKAVA